MGQGTEEICLGVSSRFFIAIEYDVPPRECSTLDTSGRGWLTFQKFCIFTRRAKISLVVQDNTEEGFIDADLALVFDKPQLPKFVHEKINS